MKILTCWRLNVAKVFTPFAGMKYPLSVIMTGMTPKSRMYLTKSDMLPSVWSSRFQVRNLPESLADAVSGRLCLVVVVLFFYDVYDVAVAFYETGGH